jgi:hypothetical protein
MELPILDRCDVLVIGGGPAGTMAAVAAARQGADTVLLEKNGFLGGNLTAAGIDTVYGLYSVGENPVKTIGGLSDELTERLERENACYERHNTYGAGIGLTFNVEIMKIAMEDMVRESGVRVYYHAVAPEVHFDGIGLPDGVLVASKSGLQLVTAKILIDTTGDADVVARAGGQYEMPGQVGPVQSCTAVFFMANVDVKRAKAFGKKAMWQAMKEGVAAGKYNLPRTEGSFHATPTPTMIEANMTRIRNVDSTDVKSITTAEIAGRKQTQEYVRFLIENVPGFEDAYLVRTGSHLGVREGRRVIGDYVLTKEDVLEGRRFDDAVIRCGQPIEDHHSGSNTRWVYVRDHGFYDIPFRCLLPKGLTNVLTAGRCLSATHDAHASARSSGTAMGMGQAAGLAAAMALQGGTTVREIEMDGLKKNLREMGAPI